MVVGDVREEPDEALATLLGSTPSARPAQGTLQMRARVTTRTVHRSAGHRRHVRDQLRKSVRADAAAGDDIAGRGLRLCPGWHARHVRGRALVGRTGPVLSRRSSTSIVARGECFPAMHVVPKRRCNPPLA